jgi:MFS family permease
MTATTKRSALTRRVPDLLRDVAFRRYWTGQTISMFGDQVSAIALPLVAVLALRVGPTQMGILTALVWLPNLLFGLHAGAWIDRRGHRRAMMIFADLGRALLLTSIPICYATGVLALWQLYVIAFGVGSFGVLFTVSNPTLFVSLVPEDKYVNGNSLIYGSRAFSFMGGPSAGGVLVQVLSAPGAILADALSYLGSAFFLARIHPAEPPTAAKAEGSLMAGARFIKTSGIVRSSLVSVSIINFFNFVFSALLVLFAIRYLHVKPGVLGLVLGLGAAGSVLGALVTARVAERIGIGRAYALGCLLFTAPCALVPAAAGPRWVILLMLAGSEFIIGFGVMMLDISIGAIFASVIPSELRSRVSGAFQAVNYGTRPLGALAGGLLGTFIGTRPTLWLAAAGGTIGFLVLLPSPLTRFVMPSTKNSDPQNSPADAGPSGLSARSAA